MTKSPVSENSDKDAEKSESQAQSLADAISLRLRKVAGALNLNSTQLSRATGLPGQTVNGYWNGKSLMKVDALFKIADTLGCNPRWLVTGQGQVEPPVELDPANADDEARMLDAFRRLRDDQRAHVLANAELLLGLVAIPFGGVARDQPPTLHSQPRPFRRDGE